ILEIDVNAPRAGCGEFGSETGLVVIDSSVEAKLILHVGALARSTRDADGSRARHLSELSDQRPNRSAGGGDHQGLARLGFADHVQAGISRKPRHAEHAEPCRDRGSPLVNLANARAIGNSVRSPSRLSQENGSLGILGATRCDNPRDRLTDHYIAYLNRLRIGLSVIHAA